MRKQQTSAAEAADFRAMEDAILEIEKQAKQLAEVETWTQTIESNCGKIRQRMEITRRSLTRQVEILNTRLADLREEVGGGKVGCRM